MKHPWDVRGQGRGRRPTGSQRRSGLPHLQPHQGHPCGPPGPTRKNPASEQLAWLTQQASVQLGCPVCHRDDKRVAGGAAGTLEMRGLGSGGSAGGRGFAVAAATGRLPTVLALN